MSECSRFRCSSICSAQAPHSSSGSSHGSPGAVQPTRLQPDAIFTPARTDSQAPPTLSLSLSPAADSALIGSLQGPTHFCVKLARWLAKKHIYPTSPGGRELWVEGKAGPYKGVPKILPVKDPGTGSSQAGSSLRLVRPTSRLHVRRG